MKPSVSKKKGKKKKKPSPPAVAAAAAGAAPPAAAADAEAVSPGQETLTLAAAAAVSETESSSSCEASTFTSACFTAGSSSSGPASTSSFSAFSSSGSSAAGEDRRDLAWLLDAFASATIDQVESAYREAGGDPFLAAGILGSTQDTQPPQPPQPAPQPPPPPDLSPRSGSGGRKAGRRPKRVAVAATGMVADVIGKDYTRPTATATTTTPPVTAPSPWKGRDDGGPAGCKYSAEEAEQFLCSMLGDNFELGMGVVRDVLGESFFSLADPVFCSECCRLTISCHCYILRGYLVM
jgi:hypothetical protein